MRVSYVITTCLLLGCFSRTEHPVVGETYFLYHGDKKKVETAIDEASFLLMSKHLRSNDQLGVLSMQADGLIGDVDAGTQVMVVSVHEGCAGVRLMGGIDRSKIRYVSRKAIK